MVVTNTVIVLCAIIALLIGVFAWYLFWAQRKFAELESTRLSRQESLRLRLSACERLILYAERTKPENLVNRLNEPSLSAGALRQVMVQAIQDEYHHNVAQQLYVRPLIWEAVTRMKDQNIFLINQAGAPLSSDAPGYQLSKQFLQLTESYPEQVLNGRVLEAIRGEAKQLLD